MWTSNLYSIISISQQYKKHDSLLQRIHVRLTWKHWEEENSFPLSTQGHQPSRKKAQNKLDSMKAPLGQKKKTKKRLQNKQMHKTGDPCVMYWLGIWAVVSGFGPVGLRPFFININYTIDKKNSQTQKPSLSTVFLVYISEVVAATRVSSSSSFRRFLLCREWTLTPKSHHHGCREENRNLLSSSISILINTPCFSSSGFISMFYKF